MFASLRSAARRSVPLFNPRDIINNLRNMMQGEEVEPMAPQYCGFIGSVEKDKKEDGKFNLTGIIERQGDTTLLISELPVKMWTQTYKEFLEGMLNGVEKKTVGAAAKKVSERSEVEEKTNE
tara:strand:+ start:217 stop:582 length:366 start_codon:yes stop_codon:yes gene_type:complete